MIGAVVKTALVMEVLQLFAGVFGQSACPKYVWYNYNPEINKMISHIQIPSPPKGVPITLTLTLNFAVPVVAKNENRLKLAQSEEESIKAINEGKPLMYEIYFSVQDSMPLITDLKLNGQVICSGYLPIAEKITRVTLSHTLNVPESTGIHNRNHFGHLKSDTETNNVSLPVANGNDSVPTANRNDSLPAANRNDSLPTANKNNFVSAANRNDSVPVSGAETCLFSRLRTIAISIIVMACIL